MSAPPAAGKSSWVRANRIPNSEWISRDNVRFALVNEDEEYFSHEDEVFDTFINFINQTLDNPYIEAIYIDATHLNKKSRNKTLNKIHKKNIEELNCVYFSTPLKICMERNAQRTGRERVPDSAMVNMYYAYLPPTAMEGYDHLYVVNENGETREVKL